MKQQGKPEVDKADSEMEIEAEVYFKRLVGSRAAELRSFFPKQHADYFYKRIFGCAVMEFRKLRRDWLARSMRGAAPNPESVYDCVLACAKMGLDPGPHAYLVPYKGEVTIIVSPDGLIELAYRTGKVKDIIAECVRSNDEFDHNQADEDAVVRVHRFATRRKDTPPLERRIDDKGNEEPRQSYAIRNLEHVRGYLTHTWARERLLDGGQICKVLTAEQVEFYRSFSQAGSGPWNANEEGMWRKTSLKRTLKYGPKSLVLEFALSNEDDTGAIPVRAVDVPTREDAARVISVPVLEEAKQSVNEQFRQHDAQQREAEPAEKKPQAQAEAQQQAGPTEQQQVDGDRRVEMPKPKTDVGLRIAADLAVAKTADDLDELGARVLDLGEEHSDTHLLDTMIRARAKELGLLPGAPMGAKGAKR